MEACEPVLPNTTLFIRDNTEADAGRGGLFNRITDENGQYLSISHNPGSHTLWSDIPTGWEQTAPERGQGTAFYDVNIANSSDTLTIDFGLRDPSDPVRNCTICDIVTEIPTAQCEVLISLYDSTGGNNWTNKAGWKQTNTPCSWFGVTCNSDSVTKIELGSNFLRGAIPNFNTLPNLQILSLHSNGLTGTIPDFSGLPNLQQLSLDTNQLTGTIPDFSGLPNLQWLSFFNNQLTGTIPNFSGLPNLQFLSLSSNQLTGDIPDFSALTNLTRIYLDANQLSGPIPDVSALTKLEIFRISGNTELCRNPDVDYAEHPEVDEFPICGNPNITLTSPADGATDISISGQVFTWEPDPVASAHRIVISTQSDFADFTEEGGGSYCNNTTTCLTAANTGMQDYTVTLNLPENTTYYWKVRASRNPTFWSEVHSFTTGAAPKTGCNGDIQLPDNLCQDVVAYYSLDNHSNDLTANGNNGVEQGSVNYLTGVKGQAANFDGIDDYIEIADSPNLHLGTDSFSMAMWLKANTFSGKNDNTSIRALTKNGYPASWWNVDISSTGSLEMEIKDAVSARSFSKLSTGTINTGEWAHITIVVDRQNAEVKHYINGVLDTTLPLPSFGEISVKGHPFEIGSGSFNPFNGLIDELYLHRRVLTDAEIQGLYDSTKPATTGCNGDIQLSDNLCEGLVVNYTFDNNAKDVSGNGNDATVNGPTLTTDRHGNADSAYNFGNGNATNSIKIPHTVLNGLTNVTTSFWIQTGDDPQQAILSGANSTASNEYLLYMDKGRQRANVKQNNDDLVVSAINNEQWHHIVVVRDGSSGLTQIFINGNLAGSKDLPTGALSIDENGLWIGREQDCVGGCFETYQDFHGKIDDLTIHNRALTASEIQAYYNSSKPKTVCNGDTQVSDNLRQDLILYMDMNGNANDVCGNGNEGTLHGNVTFVNGAASLDGDGDSISVADNPSLDLQTLTISMLINASSLSNEIFTANGPNALVYKENAYVFRLLESKLDHDFYNDHNESKWDGIIDPEIRLHRPQDNLSLDKWYFVALTFDGQITKYFVDGKLVETITRSVSINNSDSELRIGWQTANRYWHGLIDEVRIHNRPLSDNEVQNLYNATKAATTGCNAVTEIPTAQCEALVALYDSTDGDNWTNNAGWKTTNTPCSWYGIACESGAVTVINLGDINGGNNLTGSLPDLSALISLQNLSLDKNQLTGDFPDLSAFKNLVHFAIGSNAITGSIPSYLNTLTQLTSLGLGNNQLTGLIPELVNLTVLDVRENELTGAIPNLNHLERLYLSGNKLCQDSEIEYTHQEIAAFPTCGTQKPEAVIAEPIIEGNTVTLDASASMDADPDGQITNHIWTSSHGGEMIKGVNPTITLPGDGEYTITLRVIDNTGELSEPLTQNITIGSTSESKTEDESSSPVDDLPPPSVEETGPFTLTVIKRGTGEGEFESTSPDSLLDCDIDCNRASSDYPKDSEVIVSAKEDDGSIFTGWSGGCRGTENSTTVTMSRNRWCTANFELDPTQQELHRVKFAKIGDGSGTIIVKQGSNVIMTCTTAACEAKYSAPGTELTLIARARNNATFIGWGEDCSGTDLKFPITINEATKCTAEFTLSPPLPTEHRLTVTNIMETTARGYVTASGIECGDDCVENYLAGKKVWLKAHPMPHSYFKQWAGDCSGTRSAISVIMDSDKTCTAIFGDYSDKNAILMVEEFLNEAYLEGTNEKLIDVYRPIDNSECLQEAFRLSENPMIKVEEHLFLTGSWPHQFHGKEWYKPLPSNLCTKSIQIISEGTDIYLAEGKEFVKGDYIKVEVELLNHEGVKEIVPVLVYYGDKAPHATTRRRGRGYCCWRRRW